MFTLDNLKEAHLRSLLTDKSLLWARTYVDAVQYPVRRGQTLTAQVFDTPHLYNVQIDLLPDGITARCDCRYDLGGYCQHIGAVLLKWIQSPGSFAKQEVATSPTAYPIEVIPVSPPPTHQPQEPPLWMTVSAADRQRADAQRLAQWLEGFRLQDLRQMAKQRGWKLKGTRKADAIEQVAKYVTDPGDVLKAFLSMALPGLLVKRDRTFQGDEGLYRVGLPLLKRLEERYDVMYLRKPRVIGGFEGFFGREDLQYLLPLFGLFYIRYLHLAEILQRLH